MPATCKVKVRCSDRDGCGWSGERVHDRDGGRDATWVGCAKCGNAVELVGRTPNPTLELVALARARVAKEA